MSFQSPWMLLGLLVVAAFVAVWLWAERRRARYTVRADDEKLAHLAERLPSSASSDYGTPFYDIFRRYDNDFYKIDPMLFSPAEVWLTSAVTGRTFHAGQLAPDVLRASLLGSE